MHQTEARNGPWHARSIAEVLADLHTDPAHGLSAIEAADRLAREGLNVLTAHREEPWWEELFESLREPLQLLLLAVGVLYALLGEIGDALTIFAIIIAVSAVEVVNELRAKRAIAALAGLAAPAATVIREGTPVEIPTSEVVTGDLVLLGPGHRVPADLRLVETAALRIDESTLSGESAPVAKEADAALPADTELGDRRTIAHASTLVTAGKGRGVVVTTGRATELGRIASLTQEAREPRTPLQQSLRQLAGWLVWVALGFSVLVPVVGVLVAGRPIQEMLLTGLTLAFATIPEELPILITIVLGIGAYRLAQRNAIVKRLQAAETLGSVSVVATDKTGTLTMNQMHVAEVVLDGTVWSPGTGGTGAATRLFEVGVLVNDAQLARVDGRLDLMGDPTETALLAAADAAGLDVEALRSHVHVLEEHPFDDVRKRMSVVVERESVRSLAAKGAPESILSICGSLRRNGRDEQLDDAARDAVGAQADAMAARGLRVLALAERAWGLDEPANRPADEAEQRLVLLGLVGLEDPPRPEAQEAVRALQRAGLRVLMLTGDHPATARAIAERVGIDGESVVRGRDLDALTDGALAQLVRSTSVFARIAPEHKLRVVRVLQAQGEVVAVTGDGVNDAPALREAAIGVAMGRSGTDVARESADLVLGDDNLATVTTAVRAGRSLYANLRKAVRYYLAAKVALVSASLAAVLLHLPVPFEPVQIIIMELFMDLGASVTFTAEPPEEDVMVQPPRDPRRPFMDTSMQLGILAGGLSLGAAVLIPYLWTWNRGSDIAAAQTAAFATWMVGHLALAAHMRSERQPLLHTNPFANRPFLIWVASAVGLLLLGSAVPFIQDRLHLESLTLQTWLVIVAAALLCPAWWEMLKWVRRGTSSRDGG